MAREARRRCRCGEGRGKDVGLDRCEEDAGARKAQRLVFFIFPRLRRLGNCRGFFRLFGLPAVIEIIRW